MGQEALRERLSIGLGVLSILAILGILHESGWTRTEIYAAIINFSQVAIPVIVLLAAGALARASRTFLQEGREALAKVQKRYPNLLMGPRYNRENYDPEKGHGSEYLFVTNTDPASRRRVRFVTVDPLAHGLLLIHVQKGTLVYGLGFGSDEATDDEVARVGTEVAEAVKETLSKRAPNLFEVVSVKDRSVAIAVDLAHEECGLRRYGRIIHDAVTAGALALEKNRRG